MEPMDRICPFLALAADHRTAVDGYDLDHRCHAVAEPDPLDRTRQLQLCLTEAHRGCERYVAALDLRRAESPAQRAPAPDARIPRTRLVLDPAGAEQPPGAGQALLGPRARRLILAGLAALLGILVLASGAADGLAGLVAGPSVTPTPSASASLAPTPSASTTTTDATPIATPSPTPPPATPLAPTPTLVPAASPRSYVVQEGDTLVAIAKQFGTTVQAIQQANGLGDNDVINIGQVLVIP